MIGIRRTQEPTVGVRHGIDHRGDGECPSPASVPGRPRHLVVVDEQEAEREALARIGPPGRRRARTSQRVGKRSLNTGARILDRAMECRSVICFSKRPEERLILYEKDVGAGLCLCAVACAATALAELPRRTALDDYVDAVDPSYSWRTTIRR